MARGCPIATLEAEWIIEKPGSEYNRRTAKITITGGRSFMSVDGVTTRVNPYSVKDYQIHVPSSVLSELREQCEVECQRMDEFYRTALTSIAPDMVFEALTGKQSATSPSIRFREEMNEIIKRLQRIVREKCVINHCSHMGATIRQQYSATIGGTDLSGQLNLWYGAFGDLTWTGDLHVLFVNLDDITRKVLEWCAEAKRVGEVVGQWS